MGQRIIITRTSGFQRGKAQEFEQGPVTLGTDPSCDLAFDPTWDKTVATRHATLELRDNAWTVVDQSREGTWISGRKIARQKLESGDVVELGKGGPKIKIDFAQADALPPLPSAGNPAAVPAAVAHSGGQNMTVIWSLLGLVIVLLIGGAGYFVMTRYGGTEDSRLIEAARHLEPCVGLVVIVVPTKDGDQTEPIATAWAVGEHTFATNGHVAAPVKDLLAKGGSAFIIMDKSPDKQYRIIAAEPNPKYGQHLVNVEGKDPAVPAYDVGLLTVAETLPVHATLASPDELKALDSGDRVAYLGFPMEGLAGGGVDFRNPVATMQSGIITSVTDYWLSKSDPGNRLLIQHNLGATGGASGSPVFDTNGRVIGILSAGNIIGQVDFDTGKPIRAPSGVMINFAQRVDVLTDFMQDHGSNP
jgi:hypothetical protein